MLSTSSTILALALSALLPNVALAGIPPTHLSRRAADAQSALVLDPSQLSTNSEKNGQEAGAEAGQVPSLTSQNNFLNFCLDQKTDLTNGLQVKTGSCNPTIMGRIVATDKMPSAKFIFPPNQGTVAANTSFTIQMKINNLVTGNFVNAQQNYYAAPCQVDSSGTVIGHSHVVIEKIDSLASTTVTDPNVFAFFKGLNGVAVGGILTADVTGGLAPGAYRMASINSCANHQPVLAAVAQHGSLDDGVYFTVVNNGTAAAVGSNSTASAIGSNSTSTSIASNGTSVSLSASLSVKATGTGSVKVSITSAATGKASSTAKAASSASGKASNSLKASLSASTSVSVSAKASATAKEASSSASVSAKASTTAKEPSAKASSSAQESSSVATESSSASAKPSAKA